MICSFFMCLFFDPTRKLNLVTYFGQCLLLALIALASLAVYYSLVSNEAEKSVFTGAAGCRQAGAYSYVVINYYCI